MSVSTLQQSYRPDQTQDEAQLGNRSATTRTDQKVQVYRSTYHPQLMVTTEVSYEVVCPKWCNRKWVALTAVAAIPVLGFAMGYYLDLMNKSN